MEENTKRFGINVGVNLAIKRKAQQTENKRFRKLKRVEDEVDSSKAIEVDIDYEEIKKTPKQQKEISKQLNNSRSCYSRI